MTLTPVAIVRGTGSLSEWGTLQITGAQSARLKLASAPDVELLADVATDLTNAVVLLNGALGRLLCLPYAGETVSAYNLADGEELYPSMALTRDLDYGMRTANVRLIPGLGALYLVESALILFDEDCCPVWRQDDALDGWEIEAADLNRITLGSGDWAGNEWRQYRDARNGRRLE